MRLTDKEYNVVMFVRIVLTAYYVYTDRHTVKIYCARIDALLERQFACPRSTEIDHRGANN